MSDFHLLEGNLPSRAFGLVTEWAMQHQNELFAEWECVTSGQEPPEIEPLK